jgi:Ribbon-helix-helix domain
MAKGGKIQKTGDAEAFDFPLVTKTKLKAKEKEWVLGNGENLAAEFQRLRDKIDWEALRHVSNEDGVQAALSAVDQYMRDRLPTAAAILATVRDPHYPKLRPIRFIADSCALARTYPNSDDPYSPRYSRDICYQERKRRGPLPKPITDLEYWYGQAKLGQKVPRKFLGRINKLQAKEQARSEVPELRTELTYVDIPVKIDVMKKKRTTIWLPEATVAKLKKLSDDTGAPVAELFRRAVEAYLKTS